MAALRPAISVIVPFAGDRAGAAALAGAVGRLALRTGDELIVVDNSPTPVLDRGSVGDRARVLHAPEMRSSYYARNVGADAARGQWLLYLDADCIPRADLLDRYFAPPPDEDVGALAGEVVGSADQTALAARYARSRRHLYQRDILEGPTYRPMAVTANLLVRREAWARLGGFHEGIRSGGDADFSWRLQDAGWKLGYREGAAVEHRHRETLRALARQAARIGAGRAWAARRHPEASMANPLRGLARCAAGVVVWALTGRFERALFKAIDALWLSAEAGGYLLSNVAAPAPPPRGGRLTPIVALLDQFPALTETFVTRELHALREMGHPLRVEALGRADRPSPAAGRGMRVSYWEDDGIVRKLVDLAWLAARHPLGVLRDARERRNWRREEYVWPLRSLASAARRLARNGERHLHVHFGAGAALNALRLSSITGASYDVTLHAYEIWQHPRNLVPKLRRASFCTTVSDYGAEHLRELVGPSHAGRIHRVATGADGERFKRKRPYPGDGTVLAVGRLVEKKGFRYLLEAAALFDGDAPARIAIAGDGPLQDDLERRIRELGIEGKVDVLGQRDHSEIRELLEGADLFVMPSVVAADGDRDSMPQVVYEALAMEVPVIATEEVGLPEVVRPEFGRLVPPGDPAALAAAMSEVLALPAEARASMGSAGRRWVLEHRNADRELERLSRLFETVGA